LILILDEEVCAMEKVAAKEKVLFNSFASKRLQEQFRSIKEEAESHGD